MTGRSFPNLLSSKLVGWRLPTAIVVYQWSLNPRAHNLWVHRCFYPKGHLKRLCLDSFELRTILKPVFPGFPSRLLHLVVVEKTLEKTTVLNPEREKQKLTGAVSYIYDTRRYARLGLTSNEKGDNRNFVA